MNPPTTSTNSAEAPVATRFTIIYDDLATGLRAKRFADMLAHAVGAEGDVTLCRSELLEVEEVAAQMADAAVLSEFVILATRGDATLPFSTKQWLEAWLERASGGGTLIALFDPARNTARFAQSTRTYLRHVAEGAGVDFFAHSALSAPAEAARDLSLQTAMTVAGQAAA